MNPWDKILSEDAPAGVVVLGRMDELGLTDGTVVPTVGNVTGGTVDEAVVPQP